ncbi:MAG: flavodoxin family protein [Candidatus Limivicinus sp.]
MKKILILNGAGKKNGNTAALIKAFAEGAEASGNEVKEFYLQTMTIHGCLDCRGCKKTPKGDPHPCVQKDDMDQIYEAFADCDVLIFASPVYWFDISGTLKTAVDRLYAVQSNQGYEACRRETVLLMTSAAPIEENQVPVQWYSVFGQIGWKSLGMVLGTGKTEEARKLGESIT